jgi:hypothetical protein
VPLWYLSHLINDELRERKLNYDESKTTKPLKTVLRVDEIYDSINCPNGWQITQCLSDATFLLAVIHDKTSVCASEESNKVKASCAEDCQKLLKKMEAS